MLFSSGAMQINLVPRPWLAYELTGSGLDPGAVAAARALPQLLLAPIGGVIADRFNKRRVLVASQSGLAVLALVNAILCLAIPSSGFGVRIPRTHAILAWQPRSVAAAKGLAL